MASHTKRQCKPQSLLETPHLCCAANYRTAMSAHALNNTNNLGSLHALNLCGISIATQPYFTTINTKHTMHDDIALNASKHSNATNDILIDRSASNDDYIANVAQQG
jgi:hypothetical protein